MIPSRSFSGQTEKLPAFFIYRSGISDIELNFAVKCDFSVSPAKNWKSKSNCDKIEGNLVN